MRIVNPCPLIRRTNVLSAQTDMIGHTMETVLVPVRYPISEHSLATLRRAVEVAEEKEAELIVLHVDLYQNGRGVRRGDLKRAVEDEFGRLTYARYNVVRGFLVEETILEEVAYEGVDIVVIGHKQVGRWRRAFNRLIDDPDIASYLEANLDCDIVVVSPA